jgi:hypothetical protein
MHVAFGCRPGLRLSAPEGAGLTAPAVTLRSDPAGGLARGRRDTRNAVGRGEG